MQSKALKEIVEELQDEKEHESKKKTNPDLVENAVRSKRCETNQDHNWVNMGPSTCQTPRFWNTIETRTYVDLEKAFLGTYGTYLPLCRACMKSMRNALLTYLHMHPDADAAKSIAISMLAEQVFHKMHKINPVNL